MIQLNLVKKARKTVSNVVIIVDRILQFFHKGDKSILSFPALAVSAK